MPQMYDIAVLGATPAGCAAAYALAKKPLQTILIQSPPSFNESPLSDWAPVELFRVAGMPRTLAAASKAVPFRNVLYHDADLKRQVEYTGRQTAGYFVRPADLSKALTAAAVKAGAKTCTMKTRPAIHLGEQFVRLLGTTQVTARILLIAQGSPYDALGDLAMAARSAPHSFFVAAGLDIPVAGKDLLKKLGHTMHVIESRERSEIGLFFLSDGFVHLRIISSSTATGTRAAELSTMLASLQRAQVLPANLSLDKARGAVWYPPAGEALELETHVAKRCVLIGTAGGFADTITGQTLSPSIRSALLGADAAAAAVNSKDPQDSLMRFKTDWRKTLADDLRPPSTSLHMLLPLLFVNQRIVAKFTRAMLYGESI